MPALAITGELHQWNESQVVIKSASGDQQIAIDQLASVRTGASASAPLAAVTSGVAELSDGTTVPIRSRRKARDYKKIWNREQNESPFKTITRSQAERLGGILEPLGKHVIVDWAMRYANPSIASRLEVLATWGCDRILIMRQGRSRKEMT